jgi:hydroxypyruvate isomerase
MPKFAANLSMMFNEGAFLDRFAMAAEAGFNAVEFLFPYDFAPGDIRQRLQDHQLTQALFNMPPGNWEAGERGLAAVPGREADFQRAIEKAIPYIEATGVGRIHAMAGIVPDDQRAPARETYLQNLSWAAQQLAPLNIDVLIEPINNVRDIPGFFLNRTDDAAVIIAEVNQSNLKLQFDIYHCQIMEGDVAKRLEKHFPITAHIQIAGVPERHEPNIGELNYPYLFAKLDELGYDGYVGCEYRPRAGTVEGLSWLKSL